MSFLIFFTGTIATIIDHQDQDQALNLALDHDLDHIHIILILILIRIAQEDTQDHLQGLDQGLTQEG